VFVAPILPHLTDGPDQLRSLLRRLADAGATGVTGIPLHLRPGAREWFFGWLGRTRPDLLAHYEQAYARGANLPAAYRAELAGRVKRIGAELGIGSGADGQLAGRNPVRGVPGDREASFPAGSLPARPSREPDGADAPPTLF
jgi:hypothetical protein